VITETKTRKLESGVTVVEISGRLNLGNFLLSIESGIKRLIDQGARKLIVDLSQVNYIDSSGIGMLVACAGHMEQASGRLRIAGAQGTVAIALGVVHMERIAALEETVEAAVAALESPVDSATL
jgi:anti-sigma B factor antagonist